MPCSCLASEIKSGTCFPSSSMSNKWGKYRVTGSGIRASERVKQLRIYCFIKVCGKELTAMCRPQPCGHPLSGSLLNTESLRKSRGLWGLGSLPQKDCALLMAVIKEHKKTLNKQNKNN